MQNIANYLHVKVARSNIAKFVILLSSTHAFINRHLESQHQKHVSLRYRIALCLKWPSYSPIQQPKHLRLILRFSKLNNLSICAVSLITLRE